MSALRGLPARLSYRLVSRAPGGAVARARTGPIAPLLELGFAAAGAPLYGSVVPIARGPASGLRILAERRSLAWISGRVESEVQAVLTARLQPGGTFLDVGSSVGFFALLAARLVGASGTVVAFEPQPRAAASVRRNAELNGFENVHVVDSAVSSGAGDVLFEDVGKATGHIAHGESGSGGLRVSATSLDAFLSARDELRPDLVKIDVEGHEHDVLVGMETMLLELRPALVIECHGRPGELLDLLEAAGYCISVVGSTMSARDAESAHLLALA
jgi:FkbM family methyltransferase